MRLSDYRPASGRGVANPGGSLVMNNQCSLSLGVVGALAAACVAVVPDRAVGAPADDARILSCHGHRATIVGPGNLNGTRHRDVIVGTGPELQVIRARRGDDL